MENQDLITFTADIASAYVANNQIESGDIGKLVRDIHRSLSSLGKEQQEEQVKPEPAVSVRSSVKPDYLTCLVCGKKQKTLKRHLKTAHGLDPQDYRDMYGLKKDYPLTGPEYSKRRGEMAKAIGLGAKKGEKRRGKSSKKTSKQS